MIGCLLTCSVDAQDIHLTQFYGAPLYLNPAFAGADKCAKFSLAARSQWSAINKGYRTYIFSYDNFASQYNSGYGLIAASDVAGTGGLRTTLVNLNYAYEVLLTRKL